jgi:hypothetical protein
MKYLGFWRLSVTAVLLACNAAFACQKAVTECPPKKTPIVDKSGLKAETAEEKTVRRAADHFMRMELSLNSTTYGYESVEAFTRVGKKYISMPIETWIAQKDTTAQLLVCAKTNLVSWRMVGTKKYQFDYEVQSAVYHKPRIRDEREEYKSDARLLKASYQFDWVDGRWKVSRAQFLPNLWFGLLDDYMVIIKREANESIVSDFIRNDDAKIRALKHKKLVKKNYQLMQEAERMACTNKAK